MKVMHSAPELPAATWRIVALNRIVSATLVYGAGNIYGLLTFVKFWYKVLFGFLSYH
jgi:hypothetical protein